MKKFVPVLFVLALLLSACGGNRGRNVTVTSFDLVSVSPQGFGGFVARGIVGIDNGAAEMKISDIVATVRRDGVEYVTLTSDGCVVKGRKSGEYEMEAQGRFSDNLSLLQMISAFDKSVLENMYVDVTLKVSSGAMRNKTLKFRDISLNNLIKR